MREIKLSPKLLGSLAAGVLIGVLAGAGSAVSQISPPERGAAVLSPAVLRFGVVPVGGPLATRSATLVSTGRGPVVPEVAEATGSDRSDFIVLANGCLGSTLQSGASCNIDVQFRPSRPGNRRAVLRVQLDGARNVTVPMVGDGVLNSPPTTVRQPPPGVSEAQKSLDVAPPRLRAGTTFTAAGLGYRGLTELRWDGRPVATVPADVGGGIKAFVSAPPDATIGGHVLTACDESADCVDRLVTVAAAAVGPLTPLAVLAGLMTLSLAGAHAMRWLNERSERREGPGGRPCGFTADPTLHVRRGQPLAADIPLQLTCGNRETSVRVELRDRQGHRLVPTDLKVTVQTTQGPVQVTMSASGGSPKASLGAKWGSLDVGFDYDAENQRVSLKGRWGPLRLDRISIKGMPGDTHFEAEWGRVTITARLDKENPQLRIQGGFGLLTATLVLERDRVSIAMGAAAGPLQVSLDCDPDDPAVTLSADLGPVKLHCEYGRETSGTESEGAPPTVAVRARGTTVEERPALVERVQPAFAG